MARRLALALSHQHVSEVLAQKLHSPLAQRELQAGSVAPARQMLRVQQETGPELVQLDRSAETVLIQRFPLEQGAQQADSVVSEQQVSILYLEMVPALVYSAQFVLVAPIHGLFCAVSPFLAVVPVALLAETHQEPLVSAAQLIR